MDPRCWAINPHGLRKNTQHSDDPRVSARLYLPVSAAKKLPLIIYIHGGAFSIESAFSTLYHTHLNSLTAAAEAISISIEYRLAPEHLIPACYDDFGDSAGANIAHNLAVRAGVDREALKWIEQQSDTWIKDHADLNRVFLVGDSAGANIAHNLAVRAGVDRVNLNIVDSRPLALMANSNNPYVLPAPHQDQSSFNQNYLQQPMPNSKDIADPTTTMNMALALMAKAFKLNYSTPTNNNQRISSNPRNRQIAQPSLKIGQDRQIQMVGGNGGNQFRQHAGQNAGNPAGYNDVIRNQIGNGNLVAARAEGNTAGNQIRCYNCRGVGHYARNCIVRPRRRDASYLQTQLLIAQKEEQASTSGTQTDSAPVYDTDGSAEVHENCDDNEIFNMFTQEEQYTELLEPIPESHQVPQNDNDIITEDTSVEQGGEIVEQHPANFEETRALYESLYHNLAIEVEKVNSVNRKLKETNADLTTELARYKNQDRCFEISQEKYDKLERCYQQSVYQEQCLSKKINALHLSTGKQIMTLNEQISDLNKQLSKEKSTVSFLLEEKKKLKSDFKIREDDLLDKQIQLEKKIKELNNILLKTGQSIQTIHMLSPKLDSFYHTEQKMALGYQNPFYLKQAQKKQQSLYDGKVLLEKHDPPVVHDSEETLQLAQESREKMKQMNKEIKPANYTKINHLLGVFVPQTALSREELYFSNNSKMANVSKSVSIPNEDFSDDTTPSVASKFLNEDMSENTKFAKQPIVENLPKVGETNALSKPVTSNSVSTPQKSKEVDNNKTRRPQPWRNTKHDRVPSASKSSRSKNKEAEVEEHHMNLLLSKNNKHISSACYFRHMTGNLKLLINFVWKFMGTVRFGNDHVAAILGFGDLQWGNFLITRVYFVEGLGHNLFSLKGDRSTNLYTINLHEMASASPICLMARASSTKSWLWHQRLSLLNFDTINDLARNDLVACLPKFKYHKEHLCPSLERRNRTLVEAPRTMLIFSRAPLFLWVEAIATTCFTQNCSIIHRRFNKTPYEIINGRKPDISFLHVFGALCYPKNDHEDIRKLGANSDIGFFIGYSADSCAYRIYNRRTKKIMETMNVLFDDLSAMAFEQRSELDLLFEAMYDDYIGRQPSVTAKPTEKHLKEVKRVFRYLWGTINTGLWYTKDSSFELIGFSDAEYAGCKDTFKITFSGAQFLGEKLVSWSLKKQDCTALSTPEAEYVHSHILQPGSTLKNKTHRCLIPFHKGTCGKGLSPKELERLAKSQ
nr:2-hydroxyisoflavanone dehydratase-like [Tanacetum cinerariifolium]